MVTSHRKKIPNPEEKEKVGGKSAAQLQVLRFDSRLGSLSVWSLHILPVSMWVSSGCSSFLLQSKDVRVRLIGHAKLPIMSRDRNVRGISGINGDRAWGGIVVGADSMG